MTFSALGMGTKHLHICPRCGIPVTHTTRVIYVAVRDTVICGRCAERWLNNARWYSDEVKKERGTTMKQWYKKLKDSKLWEE